ncbi:putative reverse transcriptase domain-containing protein [Tanacetum coccineum]
MSSDEASSGVTYTSISNDYEEPSNAGSPGVVVYGYDGLPMHPVYLPSSDYVPRPKELEQASLLPDYVPGPEYPEYLAPSDDEIPVEDQPYAAAASPIALSSGYIPDSDPKEDSEDESEDAVDPIPFAEKTGPFETDESVATPPPPLTYRTTSRIFSSQDSAKSCIPPLPSSDITHHPAPTTLPAPSTSRRADIPEVTIPPRKRLYLPLGPRFKVGESSSSVARPAGGYKADYWFIGTLDAKLRHDRVREIGYGITDVWEDPAEDPEMTQLIAALGRIDTLEAREPAHIDAQRMLIAIKIASRRGTRTRTRTRIRTTPATATTLMTDAAIMALIAQGVADALARRTIQRNTNLNDDGSQGSGRVLRDLCALLVKWSLSSILVTVQVKFATCTLHGIVLTWWNTHVKIVGHDAAYGMPWKTLMKMMTAKYCPRNEIKKLEIEIWDLKVKGTDLASYTQCFQELALMCGRMFPKESDVVETYVGGLPDMIQGNVMSTKPKTMEEAIKMANNMMDQKLHTAYTAGPSEKKEYSGSLPKCSKCNYHHNGPCAPKCNKVGHLARDYRSFGNANTGNNQRATGANQKGGNGNALAKVYVVGNAGTNPDSNVVTGTIILNNRYASILFDTGADRSFVSTTFSSLIDITPTTLYHYYDVELADRKIIRINTIIRGCTLNFLNNPFNIDLMPVELGSFNVIIGMDWLAKYHAVIVCDEKLVRIPWGNETLIVHGDGSNRGNESCLNIISCTKTQKYMLKGCHVFLAHVTTKETEGKL